MTRPRPLARLLFVASALAVVIAATGVRADDAETATSIGDTIVVREEAQPGTDVAWGSAVAVVARPIDDVWRIVTDYPSYAGFLPHFRASRVLARRGNDAMLYLEVGVMRDTVTLWGQVRVRAADQAGRRRVDASLVRGNMDRFEARWELAPLDGGARTLVHFRILVEPDLPVPDSLLTHENVKAARKTLRALRRRMGAG